MRWSGSPATGGCATARRSRSGWCSRPGSRRRSGWPRPGWPAGTSSCCGPSGCRWAGSSSTRKRCSRRWRPTRSTTRARGWCWCCTGPTSARSVAATPACTAPWTSTRSWSGWPSSPASWACGSRASSPTGRASWWRRSWQPAAAARPPPSSTLARSPTPPTRSATRWRRPASPSSRCTCPTSTPASAGVTTWRSPPPPPASSPGSGRPATTSACARPPTCWPAAPERGKMGVGNGTSGERKTRALLAHADLSALLVTKPANVRYLTGFSGSYGALLLLHDRTLFFTDRRYERQAAVEVPGTEVVLAPGDLIGGIASVLRAAGDGLGFEPAGLTWGDGQRLRAAVPGRAVVPAPPLVEDLREVKDEREVATMREAARLGSEALTELLAGLRAGVTEREVAVALELTMRRLGGDGLAFDSIVAFGEHAAEPHHHPVGRRLRRGDFVKLDFGARVDGYCSDMTRTVVFGRASERQREVYEVVQRAQAAGLGCLRAGVPVADV